MLNYFVGLLNRIPQILLLLPSVLISLSIHESAHGYAAYKLGDDTAKSLGRITLNPAKHFNLLGFLSMLFFSVGWAEPVPINARNFKKPRRDMAITAAAGPLSNLCLAVIFTVLLRIVMIPLSSMIIIPEKGYYYVEDEIAQSPIFIVLALLAVMLYFGISLNLNLMIFNLIPIPPFDGSRIAYIFLPTDLYFKIMRYERYIMIGFIVLLASGIIDLPLSAATNWISDLLFSATGMPEDQLLGAISDIFRRLPTFSF